MKYIVAKRKLMRKIEKMEKDDLDFNNDETLYNVQGERKIELNNNSSLKI